MLWCTVFVFLLFVDFQASNYACMLGVSGFALGIHRHSFANMCGKGVEIPNTLATYIFDEEEKLVAKEYSLGEELIVGGLVLVP